MTVHTFDRPFRHWVIDGLVPIGAELAAAEVAQSLRVNPAVWKPYDDGVQRKCLVDDPRDVGPDTAALVQTLTGPYQLTWFRQHLGIDIPDLQPDPTGHGGSVHVLRAGDYLGTHIDRDLHPYHKPPMELRVNLLLFLVPEWSPGWGGALRFFEDDTRTVGAEILPAPGRAVAWCPDSLTYHGVQRVSDDCPVPRATCNLFFYAPARASAVRKRALFAPPAPMAGVRVYA